MDKIVWGINFVIISASKQVGNTVKLYSIGLRPGSRRKFSVRASGVDVGGHSKILRIGCEMQVPVHAAFFQVPQQSRLDWDDSAPPKTIPSKFWGVNLRTSLVLQCFCAPAPQVRGVKSSPSKHWGVWVFQGMGTPRLSLHETRRPDSPNLLHELLSIDSLGCSSPRIKAPANFAPAHRPQLSLSPLLGRQ